MEHFEAVLCIILAGYFFLDIHFKFRKDRKEFNPDKSFDKFADKVISKMNLNIETPDFPEKGMNLADGVDFDSLNLIGPDYINIEDERVYHCNCFYVKINEARFGKSFYWLMVLSDNCLIHEKIPLQMDISDDEMNINEIIIDLKKRGRLYQENDLKGTGSETTG